jgi:hypothetical protein
MKWLLPLASFLLAFACKPSSSTSASSSSPDASAAEPTDEACAGKQVPDFLCAGGKRQPRCNLLASGESRWQIDCLRDVEETAPSPGTVFSACAACAEQPAWDDAACQWGFAGAPACLRFDNGASCTWWRTCRPKPCSDPNPDPQCNTLVSSKLGAPCDEANPWRPCPEGSSCASVFVNAGDPVVPPTCIIGRPCDALVCAPGKVCSSTDSSPSFVRCGER